MTERAIAGDPRVETFYFGSEPWAVEVEEELKSGIWEEDRDLWLFLQEEELVAGARLGFWKLDPPHRHAPFDERQRYYLVIAFGVNVPFQGERDPGSPAPGRSYARSILAYIEAKARTRADCVGLSLWVRVNNYRARRVYETWGFDYDPAGPFDDEGEPTLEMKKWFA